MRRLWIADADAAQRRAIGWALRDRFDVIDDFDCESALSLALQISGHWEELVESRSGEWLLLALTRGEAGHLTIIACRGDECAALVRRCVHR